MIQRCCKYFKKNFIENLPEYTSTSHKETIDFPPSGLPVRGGISNVISLNVLLSDTEILIIRLLYNFGLAFASSWNTVVSGLPTTLKFLFLSEMLLEKRHVK